MQRADYLRVVAEVKPLKFDVDGDVADRIRESFDKKKIGYSEGAEAIFRWFNKQDGMLQSLILGQVDEKYEGEVAKMILTRLTVPKPKHSPMHATNVGGRKAAKPMDDPD